MLAGGSAGACQIVITTPMELLKIQMQDAGRVASAAKSGTQPNIKDRKDFIFNTIRVWTSRICCVAAGKILPKVSAWSLTKELLKRKGVLGLYQGTGATALRDVTFSVIYFPLFARLNSLGPKRDDGSCKFVAEKLRNRAVAGQCRRPSLLYTLTSIADRFFSMLQRSSGVHSSLDALPARRRLWWSIRSMSLKRDCRRSTKRPANRRTTGCWIASGEISNFGRHSGLDTQIRRSPFESQI